MTQPDIQRTEAGHNLVRLWHSVPALHDIGLARADDLAMQERIVRSHRMVCPYGDNDEGDWDDYYARPWKKRS
jgi:hypothetical protein